MVQKSCLLICSTCKTKVPSQLFYRNLFFIAPPSRGYRWKPETHYDILGVHPDATQAEIKAAYLTLSKELHPDLNQGASKQDSELIHQKFVKVTQAYSTLSNRRERNIYDLQTLIRTDPRNRKDESQRGGPGRAHVFSDRPMTFEERAKAMGYAPQDPDFYKKHKDYHKKILVACLVWIVGGAILTRLVIMYLYNRHTTELDHTTKLNMDTLKAARDRATKKGSLEEQKKSFDKMWGDDKEKYEAEMRKYEEGS